MTASEIDCYFSQGRSQLSGQGNQSGSQLCGINKDKASFGGGKEAQTQCQIWDYLRIT